jgi:hypothetical protein
MGKNERVLEEVRNAAIDLGVARGDLARVVAKARQRGHSLRAIADAAGMSHEQIRRIAPR